MYESFFQLIERPFAAMPQIEHYFPARTIEAARRNLVRCIDRAEGMGVLVGPSGTGKTLVCQMLRHQFRDAFDVVLLGDARLDGPRSVLQTILFGLGLPCRGMDDGDMRLALIDHLTRDPARSNGLLLIADEAHLLPARVLEEIRLISNVAVTGKPRVRFVMVGSPLLEEHLASPKLESFSQRTATRAYLEPLDRTETVKYVYAQIAAVGGNARSVFAESAFESVYRATDGVPRLVNQLCDHALVLAFANGIDHLGEREIEEAWADLQQLPTPWSGAPVAGQPSGVVEFGQLDDEDEPAEPSTIGLRLASDFDDDAEAEIESDLRGAQLHGDDQIDERLDAIEEQVAELAEESPLMAAESYATTSVTVAPGGDPFFGSFAEEEVIVERYRTAHTAVWDQMPHVYSNEGRVLAALLDTLVETAQPTPAEQTIGWSEAHDRDLIIVEDDPPTIVPVRTAAPKVVRQEYSQLFAKLRRG